MSALQAGKVLQRDALISMIRAALQSGDYRFARQAALAWLAAFPGDLEVTLFHAQAVLGDGKPAQVVSMLDQVWKKDPFYRQAYRLLAQVGQQVDPERAAFAASSIYVLDGVNPARTTLQPWAEPLRQVLNTLSSRQFDAAEQTIQLVLSQYPDLVLAGALHLLLNRSTQKAEDVSRLAEGYHTRWPDCLQITLVLAEMDLEQGKDQDAVQLLHQCASADTLGQTAVRLWGSEHPYRSLWPDDLVIYFDHPIPAAVAARLGWNILPTGQIPVVSSPVEPVILQHDPALEDSVETAGVNELAEPNLLLVETEPEPISSPESLDLEIFGEVLDDSAQEDTASSATAEEAAETKSAPVETGFEPDPISALPADLDLPAPQFSPSAAAVEPESNRPVETPKAERARSTNSDDTLQEVNHVFERLAKELKQPSIGRADGRAPVYVIFTSREGLNRQYGAQTTALIEGELRKLATFVARRPGWNSLVYYPDDAASTGSYGLTPVNPRDPWKLKMSLVDLDEALAKNGEMIGALLIVGGDMVIPFHQLPNPTDDSDGKVPSDSPYATLDANYFVPEWPVGRLPGEKGPDAGLLLEQLRQVLRYHTTHRVRPNGIVSDWLAGLENLFRRIFPGRSVSSFGYTAAVWRRSSLAVFRPIGAPHTVLASPPAHSGSVDRERVTASNLGYYNLHGLQDSPAWYGQRDPAERSDAPDYPVALTPEDLHRNGHSPRVVFSEACYGGYTFGKCVNESLALKFLALGTQIVVASTTISYGSVNTPLIAADLLGNLFWQHLRLGKPAGEAFMQAKVDLVREMNRRQGFLDGEDQKTLISFVLYGDPLVVYDGFHVQSKSIRRLKDHPSVKTVSDHGEEGTTPPKLSNESLKQVKQIVAEYLPGADISRMHLARQSAPAPAAAHQKNGTANGRVVVTLSKQVQTGHYIHKHFVRVTLDESGNPVKMSISR